MKNSRYWFLFAAGCLVWLSVSLLIAPAMNGADVMIFRDAGWNLASTGHYQTAGVIYMNDLKPRLFAHYPPIYPFLFSAYLTIFPKNAYAGTVFNLLLGYAASACALFWVLRSKLSGRLKTVTAIAFAIFPLGMVTYDRPEALGFVLAVLFLTYAAHPASKPWWAGILAAVVFLGEPYAALMALTWFFLLTIARNWGKPRWMLSTLYQVTAVVAVFALALGVVAAWFAMLDAQALHRFAEHALGRHSGAGVVLQNQSGYLQNFSTMMLWQNFHWVGLATFHELYYVTPGFLIVGYAVWMLTGLRRFSQEQRLVVCAGLAVAFLTIFLFPAQYNYLEFVPFFVPVALLISERSESRIQTSALAFLLAALVFINLPEELFFMPIRAAERNSYREEQQQLDYLAAHLPSRDTVVAFQGVTYDYFKPRFPRLFNTFYYPRDGSMPIGEVGAIVNCYRGYDGAKGAHLPLPAGIDAAEFRLAEAVPEHVYATILGHRLTNREWGFGCDIYLRNMPAPDEQQSHF